MIHRNSAVAVVIPARPTRMPALVVAPMLVGQPVANRLWRYCLRRPMAAALSAVTTAGLRLVAGRPLY